MSWSGNTVPEHELVKLRQSLKRYEESHIQRVNDLLEKKSEHFLYADAAYDLAGRHLINILYTHGLQTQNRGEGLGGHCINEGQLRSLLNRMRVVIDPETK